MRQVKLALVVILMAGLCVGALAQGEKAETKITLSVADEAAADVAAKLTAQAGVQIGVVSPCTAKAKLDLTDAKTEAAVKAFAESIEASWVRAYVIEKQPPATPYTADQLYAGLSNQRQNWFNSLTDEQRTQLMESWRTTFGGGFGRGGRGGPGQGQPGQPPPAAPEGQAAAAAAQDQAAPQPPPEYPGAGRSNMMRRLMQEARAQQQAQPGQAPAAQPAQGGPGGPGGFGGFRNMSDPVRDLTIPVRTESVTLQLQDAPLSQALYDLTTVSGFIVAAGADLTGNITLDVEGKPIEEVLTQIATAVGGQWRPIYLLSVPRPLTDAEQEQQQEQRFQSQWARYWAMPADQRAQEMQRRIDGINRMAEAAKQPGQDGQPNRAAAGLQRMGGRMMSRLTKYAAGLDPDRRSEITPLVRAMGKALAGQ